MDSTEASWSNNEQLRGMSPRHKTNPDILSERDGASFNPMHLTNILDGSPKATYRRRFIENLVLTDPAVTDPLDRYCMSRPEAFNDAMRLELHCLRKIKEFKLTDPGDIAVYRQQASLDKGSGLAVHHLAFVPMFKMQSSGEQKQRWLEKIENLQIIGNYGQTELGHGSFVRGLETTAVYDENTQEFILNTPSLTSTKWWVGSLGKTSNWSLVMAQLYTKGKERGVHAFMVPIRDMETHKPLPGISVGDIGDKYGYDEVDNGYLVLNEVRIPRDYMLMGYSEVARDGTFLAPANDKIMYAGMLQLRAGMPLGAARQLATALTIAIRYSCVRRQSELVPGDPEPKILDFQTQQHKLFPFLCEAYAFWFVGQYMDGQVKEGMKEILEGNFENLQQLHALSSALKAYCSLSALNGIESCRLACGGHGYSLSSGLPSLFKSSAPSATVEGEATVLYLQSGRFLIKSFQDAPKGKQSEAQMSYINQHSFEKPSPDSKPSMLSLANALAFRAKRRIEKASHSHLQARKKGLSYSEAYNSSGIAMVAAVEAHVEYVLVTCFADKLNKVRTGGQAGTITALEHLGLLFAVNIVINGAADLLDGYMSESDMDKLRQLRTDLYAQVRRDAVAYVDAFDFTDRHLGSVLGAYDGNVYQRLYDWALKSPLNKTKVHESYEKYLQPMQKSKL